MTSKKGYVDAADRIGLALRFGVTEERELGAERVIDAVCESFKASNAKFDPDKFREHIAKVREHGLSKGRAR
jgi:hypothetical protein